MKILCICLIMLTATLTGCTKTKVEIEQKEPIIKSGDVVTSSDNKNVSDNLDDVLEAYKNFINTSNREEYPDSMFSIINLDDSKIPFLFDGYKFYHYENGEVKEVLGYTADRADRTAIYVKEKSPLILEIYNIFGEQSWKIYKYENATFIEIYYSGSYAMTEEAILNGECEAYTDEIGKDIDANINRELETIDYNSEYNLCNTFITIEEAINLYKSN